MGIGHKSYSQAGKESDWATPAIATEKVELLAGGDTFKLVQEPIYDTSLHDGVSHRDILFGPRSARGTQRHTANYNGFLERFRAILGTYSTTIPGSGVVRHKFIEGDGPPLTIETGKGDVPTGKVFTCPGAKATGFTFEITRRALPTFAWDWIAQDMIGDQDPSASLSFPTKLPLLWDQIIDIDDGSGDLNPAIRSFKCSITRAHDDGEDDIRNTTIGEPLPQEHLAVEFMIEKAFKTLDDYNAAVSKTTGQVAISFRHPTILTGSIHREFLILAPTCVLVDYDNPVNEYGRLYATSTWRAKYQPGSLTAVKIEIQNEQSALT